MAQRLQEAEGVIERLQQANLGQEEQRDQGQPQDNDRNEGPDTDSQASRHSPYENGNVPQPQAVQAPAPAPALSVNGLQAQSIGPGANMAEHTTRSLPGQASDGAINLQSSNTPSAQKPLTSLSLDEHGKICYYGPTSAVHEPVCLDSPSSHSSSGVAAPDRHNARYYLSSHAQESATWEEFALGNAALQTGISRQVMAKLLHVHWTWVAPMFMWVYRPAFMRT